MLSALGRVIKSTIRQSSQNSSGASYVEATALGNLAAGIVVRKSGTATTSQKEMLETLEQLNIPE